MKICKTSNTWIEGKRTVEKKDLSVRENRELEFSIYPFFYLSIKLFMLFFCNMIEEYIYIYKRCWNSFYNSRNSIDTPNKFYFMSSEFA